MRTGFSVKEIAEILGVHPNKAGQSLDPAIEKIARLFRASAIKTMLLIMERAAELETDQDSMSESELECLARFQTGRLDRKVLHPNGRR